MTWAVDVVVEPETNTATLVLSGEADYERVEELRCAIEELARGSHERVEIDLTEITFLDSTTIGVLVQARRDFEVAGRDLRVANPSDRVRRILEAAGVTDFLLGQHRPDPR